MWQALGATACFALLVMMIYTFLTEAPPGEDVKNNSAGIAAIIAITVTYIALLFGVYYFN